MALPTAFTSGDVFTAANANLLRNNQFNQTVNTSTTSYVLVASDVGTRRVMNAASATTITVNTSLFSAGDTLTILNIGAGVCTVTAGTATVSTSGTLALVQNAGGTLYFTSAGVSVFQADGVGAAASTSRIWLNTFNGYGSSSTKIPRYTTTVVNSGSDITYADSASLGSTFTINTAGMYAMMIQQGSPISTQAMVGISLNSTQLTTNIVSVTPANRLALNKAALESGDTVVGFASSTFYFSVNDVIRPQTNGSTPNTASESQFMIVRLN